MTDGLNLETMTLILAVNKIMAQNFDAKLMKLVPGIQNPMETWGPELALVLL